MKIAIIEDDKITRLELSKLLNSHGYETVLLTDFENLSEESKKYSFDLILLDINLPYENGYEICRKMKSSCLYRLFCDKQGHKRRRTAKYSGRRDRFYHETI